MENNEYKEREMPQVSKNATTSQEKIEILIKLRGTVTKMKVLEVSNFIINEVLGEFDFSNCSIVL